ncbi:hypothetical protein QOZ80_2BG0194470 [Eleusine coracana subsp. coracana]|nr:hypothetical protein QOZ80_2BG0194470 [Eleusine coracana subsp. coracana]
MKRMDQRRTSGGTAGNEPAKRTIRGDAPAAEAGGGGGCFDCNICLDAAADPVVTLCGHLYCWPCIYEWLRPETDADAESRSSARRQFCPVCKAAVTPNALVPLYGRGSSARPEKPPRGVLSIPRRPAVPQSDQHHHHQQQRNVQPDRPGPPRGRHHAGAAEFDLVFPPPFRDRAMTHSMMAGGLAMAALPWVLRGQEQPPSMYFPSPYHLTPSQRRQHVELERSLHQIWLFLFLLVLLCFLLF